MITVIIGTNRPDSNTSKIAEVYLQYLKMQGVEVSLLPLVNLPENFLISDFFGKRSQQFSALIDEFIVPANKIILVVPEYSGSFPGILKSFIDAVPHEYWIGKKIALTGVATGRGGNIRGLDHLTGILNYLAAAVYPRLLPISQCHTIIDQAGTVTDSYTLTAIKQQTDGFLDF